MNDGVPRSTVMSAFAAGMAATMTAVVLWLFYAAPVAYVYFINEDHWAEHGTFALAAMACAFLLLGLRTRPDDSRRKIGYWLVLVSVAFMVGEEISWGQRIFGFEAPGFLARRNWQSETNLHNVVHMDTTPLLTIAIVAWLALTPLCTRLAALARGVGRLGLPLVPYRLWPLFGLAIGFAVSPLPKKDEVTELCFGLALAAFSVDFAVGARWLARGRARLAVGTCAATVVAALAVTALMVAFLDYPRDVLRLRLTQFAAERLPARGMNVQAGRIFDYLARHPELRTDRTALLEAAWLTEQKRETEARPILARVLARAHAAQRAADDDPAPWRQEAAARRLLGEEDAARTALGRARQIDEARLSGLEKAPEIARVRISLATTLHALGDTEAALAELDAAERGLAGSATSALVEDRRLQLSIERLRRKLRGR